MALGTPQVLVSATKPSGSSSLQATVTATSQQGDAIVVGVSSDSASNPSITSVTDSQGNTYTDAFGTTINTTNLNSGVWYALNAKPLVSGTDWIKVIWSGGTGEQTLQAMNCSGVSAAGALDIGAFTSGSSNAPSTGTTGTLAQADEWAVTFIFNANAGGTPSSPTGGMVIKATAHPTGGEYSTVLSKITSSTASFTPGASITSAVWSCGTITLTEAAAGQTYPLGTYADAPGTATTAVLTLAANVSAGDALVLAAASDTLGELATGITDSQGNTWVKATSDINSPDGLTVWYVLNSAAMASGTDTITVTFSGSSGSHTLTGRGCAGISPAGALDVAITNDSNAGAALNSVSTFESGLGPWFAVGAGFSSQTLTQDSGWSYAGTYSAKVTPDGVHAQVGIWSEATIPVTAGQQYTAEAVCYIPAGWTGGTKNVQVVIWWFTSGGVANGSASSGGQTIPAATPVLLNFSATAPAGTAKAQITFSTQGASDVPAASTVMYYDQAKLMAGQDTSASPSVGPSSALAQASEWAVAFLCNANGGGAPTAWTGGFTAGSTAHATSNQYLTGADQIVNATSALTAGATVSSAKWNMALVTFKFASVQLTNNAEGAPSSGTAVTQGSGGNSGGASGNYWDNIFLGSGASCIFDNAHAAHGTYSYKFAGGGSAVQTTAEWNTSLGSGLMQVWVRAYFFMTAFPAANVGLLKFAVSHSGAQCGRFVLNSTGHILANDGANSNQLTSTITVPTNAWWRIEATVLASATAGVLEYKLFTTGMDNTSPDETKTATSLNTNGSGIGETSFGQTGTGAASFNIWGDDIGASTSGYLGPVGSAPPSVPGSFLVFSL